MFFQNGCLENIENSRKKNIVDAWLAVSEPKSRKPVALLKLMKMHPCSHVMFFN